MKKTISVSILDSNDVIKYLETIKILNENLHSSDKMPHKVTSNFFDIQVHFDVMDNIFVPNTGVEINYIKFAKNKGFYADTHLMVSYGLIKNYIEKVIELGTDCITIHYEIDNFEEILHYLNEKKAELFIEQNRQLDIAIAIKPETEISSIKKYKNSFSKLLIMTVEPGFGGQKYIETVNFKIAEARKVFKEHTIQIDGGINLDTIREPLNLDVDSFVLGSFISKQKSEELYNTFLKLNIIKLIEELPKDSNIEFDSKLFQIVPGGYGEDDILIGITVPNIRKISQIVYKYISLDILQYFVSSKYHEYRKFAGMCISSMMKNQNSINTVSEIMNFFEKNLKYINNWDLTDEVAPKVLGYYLLKLSKSKRYEKIVEYLSSENFWTVRIGIVSLLTLIKEDEIDFVLSVLKLNLYNEFHLIQKANGWILREVYKKDPKSLILYLQTKSKEKKLPNILLSYACEKMPEDMKESIKNI